MKPHSRAKNPFRRLVRRGAYWLYQRSRLYRRFVHWRMRRSIRRTTAAISRFGAACNQAAEILRSVPPDRKGSQ